MHILFHGLFVMCKQIINMRERVAASQGILWHWRRMDDCRKQAYKVQSGEKGKYDGAKKGLQLLSPCLTCLKDVRVASLESFQGCNVAKYDKRNFLWDCSISVSGEFDRKGDRERKDTWRPELDGYMVHAKSYKEALSGSFSGAIKHDNSTYMGNYFRYGGSQFTSIHGRWIPSEQHTTWSRWLAWLKRWDTKFFSQSKDCLFKD